MTIEEFIKALDFGENDYFYHVTSKGNAEAIIEEGLYVDGTNILNADNILETTTLPLTEDLVATSEEFQEFLDDELNNNGLRDTSEIVVLGAPKAYMKQIVDDFSDFKDGSYYEGVIPTNFVMGYFDKDTMDFTPNEGFEFVPDGYYETETYKTH